MTKDLFRYDRMVETALRGVVREALSRAAKHGLSGAHHFYVTFRTGAPGVVLPDYLRAKYPAEMTIVLEHQFWDLEIGADSMSVTLSFQNRPERLTVPLAAITAFADPSVKFGLQFQDGAAEPGAEAPAGAPSAEEPAPGLAAAPAPAEPKEEKKAGEVVALDKFRKK
jgi:uncharacterized protein